MAVLHFSKVDLVKIEVGALLYPIVYVTFLLTHVMTPVSRSFKLDFDIDIGSNGLGDGFRIS